MAQKRRKPRPATKQEFLADLHYLSRIDFIYKKWCGRPNDAHFFLMADCTMPLSCNVACAVVDDFLQRRAELTVRCATGREWAVLLLEDFIMDRLREVPNLQWLGEWFDSIKDERPRFVPLLGLSISEDSPNEPWRVKYDLDPDTGMTPSLN